MQQIIQTLSAGQTLDLAIAGDYFRLQSCPDPVDIVFYKAQKEISRASGMDTGFYLIPSGGYDRVVLTTATAQTVKLMFIEGNGGYDHFNVDITSALNALTVNIMGQAQMSLIQADTIVDKTPVTVGTSAVLLAAASAARKALRIFNGGTADVYIGSSAVTTTNGALKVGPGQTWIETDAAPAAWYGTSSAAGQSVRIQEVSI